MITADVYEVEDFYEFSTGQRVTVRVTLSDSAPEESCHTVLSGRGCLVRREKTKPRKGSVLRVRVPVAVAAAAKRLQ